MVFLRLKNIMRKKTASKKGELKMIFKIILRLRYRPEFKFLACSLVFSLLLSLSGCATTETLRVESENITHNMNYEIAEVKMKDGKVVDLRGKSPLYAEEWDNKKNVILYTNDTVWTSEKRYSVSDEIKIIELGNVRWVTLERTDKDVEVTVTTKSGIRHKGGLLSVTDNKISLSNKKLKHNVTVIEKDSIKKVLIHGESNELRGLCYGALIGTGTGALLGALFLKIKVTFFTEWETSPGQNALIGGLIGSLIGSIGGLLVGIASSTPDKTIEIKSDDDYIKLMRYIKHPSYEPLIYRYYKEEKNKEN